MSVHPGRLSYRACPTVEEYVLVDNEEQEVQVYRRQERFWVLSTFSPGDEVDAIVDIRIPMVTIHEDVSFV